MVSENKNNHTLNLQHDIHIDENIITYSLNGKITSEIDYENLEKDVFNYLNQNYYRVIFDLEKLTYTNSSGIGFFLRTLTKTRIMGGELVLTQMTGNVQKIFEIAKLNEVYAICSDNGEAKEYFKNLQ